ncbi:kinase-like protein [Tuber magnatum]|uniref:non-specific serine/threonine protein kinase n=1 Tax=Tuber magnatum TaxID=42249 RepID=A0A317SFG8_9PEZI|nr:kinase-like protein [Tuber magnatum]
MAILAKRPLLFVEFLGWFEEPETLYIAMEYLEEGDLTRHIGTPLLRETIRNISKQILEGLENIFVVSMSPVWVKLGDFGISKRIQAHDTTTFHTRVSTPGYSAPEALGLDSNSETSDYTNSVDIWSLGCVVYELLVGERLFVSDGQVLRYYLGKWRFPEDKLKGLSPPTDDAGILLLESMLTIQPENRPTAAGALRHAWFTGLKSDYGNSGDDQDEARQSWAESTKSRKSENKLPAHGKPKKRRSGGSPITHGNTEYTPRDTALGSKKGSPRRNDPSTPRSVVGNSAATPPDAPSIEGSLFRMEPLESQLTPRGFNATRSKGTEAQGNGQIHSTPQTYLQGDVQNTKPNLSSEYKTCYDTNENWLLNPRPPASDPSTPHLRYIYSVRSTPRTNGPMELTQKHRLPTPILDEAMARMARRQAHPARQGRFGSHDSETSANEVPQNFTPDTLGRGDGRNQDTIIKPIQDPNSGRNPNARPDLSAGQNPNTRRSPKRNTGIGRNSTAGWNPKQYHTGMLAGNPTPGEIEILDGTQSPGP